MKKVIGESQLCSGNKDKPQNTQKKEVMLALPYIRESAEQEATGH